MEFKIEINSDGLFINKIEGKEEIDARGLSGYEMFVSNLALRIAFGKMNSETSGNYIIIDEGFTSSSSENLAKFENLFNIIRKQYKWCIVVSHLEQIKDNYDNSYFIKRNIRNESQIEIK